MATWVDHLYPGGSRQIFGPATLSFKKSPAIFVLHTTETMGFPAYPHGNEPHLTVDPRRRTWRQHIPLNKAAYALKAAAVSTNTWGAIQVEIIGYAATMKDIAQPDLDWLGGLLRMVADQTNIPLISHVTFAGPSAYGVNGAVRLSNNEWLNYVGFLGHQHVPGNSHWDPGALDITQWMNAITDKTDIPLPPQPTPEEEEDMATLTGIIFDASQGEGYGSTAVYNETIGWVQTSVGLGPRDSYGAYIAIGNALGFRTTEVHVDQNGWILSQLFKNPSPDVPDVVVDVETLAETLSKLLPAGQSITAEQISEIAKAVNDEAHDRLAD